MCCVPMLLFINFVSVVIGLTVLRADEVYDIMEHDYPEKFKVCLHVCLGLIQPLFLSLYITHLFYLISIS